WWTERSGRSVAIEGSDGNCRTVPPVVADLMSAAEPVRRRAVSAGFAPIVGDGPPATLRDVAFTRQLLRVPASVRVQALRQQRTDLRRAYLAGLNVRQFAVMTRGMSGAARRVFGRERTLGLRGRPRDFVGGDRRVDVVLDVAGATGYVRTGQTGLAVCRTRGDGGRRSFVASWLYLLMQPGDTSVRATLAHEAFHVVQCVMNTRGDAPQLLREGSAEWFSVLSEPASFPGAVGLDGAITAGNARAASFCNEFDPRNLAGLDVYSAWAVWEALDPATRRASLVPRLLRVYRRATGDGDGVIRRVGEARWSQALLTAARTVCGTLTSPSGRVTFAPQVRGFLGSRNQPAEVGRPATITLPPGGLVTVGAVWGQRAVGAASVSVGSPAVAPDVLAQQIVVSTALTPLTPGVRDGQAAVDIPAESLNEGYVPVTIANPSASSPVQVTVQVTTLPPAPPPA
ncbi:MAG: hypothetical protein RJQ03_09515, partial [Miltoncostaeaceae bacterium]